MKNCWRACSSSPFLRRRGFAIALAAAPALPSALRHADVNKSPHSSPMLINSERSQRIFPRKDFDHLPPRRPRRVGGLEASTAISVQVSSTNVAEVEVLIHSRPSLIDLCGLQRRLGACSRAGRWLITANKQNFVGRTARRHGQPPIDIKWMSTLRE